MQNLVLLIVTAYLFAFYTMTRSGRRGDRPMRILALAIAGAGAYGVIGDAPLFSLGAVLVGLLVGLVPPYLAMAGQLSRLRGDLKGARFFNGLAALLQPTATRRMHHGIARILGRSATGALEGPALFRELEHLESMIGPAGSPSLVEAVLASHAVRRDWAGLLARLPDLSDDGGLLSGLTMGSRAILVQALCQTGRTEDATSVLDGMEAVLRGEKTCPGVPGETAEVPEAWLNRARIHLLACMGVSPTPHLGRTSSLRAFFSQAQRSDLDLWAGKAEAPGPWHPAAFRIERLWNALAIERRLPGFLTSLRVPAPVSLALVIINTFLLVLLMWTGSSLDPTHLLRAGGCQADLVRSGDYWRLLSSMFLHAGPVHLAVNGLFLLQAGTMAERLLGSTRFAGIYLVSGIAGSLAAVMFGKPGVMVGASGAICGILAAGGLSVLAGRRKLPVRWYLRNRGVFAWTIVANIFLGVALPMISLSAHGGGFLAGLVVTALLLPAPRMPRLLRSAGAVLTVVAWVGLSLWAARGVGGSLDRPVRELVPIVQEDVHLLTARADADIVLAVPVTWAEFPREIDGLPRHGWAGLLGQLFWVEASCGDTWWFHRDDIEVPIVPGDTALLAESLLEAAEGAVKSSELIQGPNGFVRVSRTRPSGATEVTAHRLFPGGMVHLGFLFEAGGSDVELLEPILSSVSMARCMPLEVKTQPAD